MKQEEIKQIDRKIRTIKFKDSEDVYEFPLLSFRDNRKAFLLFTSLLLPVLPVIKDTYVNYTKEIDHFKLANSEDSPVDFTPEMNLFDVSTVISSQIGTEDFDNFLEILIPSLKKNGNAVELEDAFQGDFDSYLKLVEYSFKENLGIPLVRWLEGQGLTGIVTYLQQVATDTKEVMKR